MSFQPWQARWYAILLPTIPAPMTTTLAWAGRPATRIPSSVFNAGSQHSEENVETKPSRLTSAHARQHLLHIGAEDSTAEAADQSTDEHAARSAAGADD